MIKRRGRFSGNRRWEAEEFTRRIQLPGRAILFTLQGGYSMKIKVNGEELVLEQPDYVTVQKNDEFIDHDKFEGTLVNEGDTIEFLYFMGGGSR